MERLLALPSILLFSLACNLDTVLLAMSYGARGLGVPLAGRLAIALLTTAVTWVSLALGGAAGELVRGGLPQVLGGLVLVGMGLWFLLDALRGGGRQSQQRALLSAPALWAWVPLAAALAVNNGGIGVAAGLTGVSPLGAACCNFLMTLAALPLGSALGRRWADRFLGQYALPLSGLLLLLLGAWEALF